MNLLLCTLTITIKKVLMTIAASRQTMVETSTKLTAQYTHTSNYQEE